MTDDWTCAFCETANAHNDDRCVVCDRPRVTIATSTTTALGSPDRGGHEMRSGRRVWPAVTVVAVLVVLTLVTFVVVLDRRASDDRAVRASTGPTSGSTPSALASPSTSSSASSSSSSSTSSSTSATVRAPVTTTTITPPTVATVTTSPVTAAPSTLGGGGSEGAPVAGSWTAIFISCDDEAACMRAATSLRSVAPAATLVAPGTYRSLRPFWIVAAGSFPTGEAVAAYCRAIGRTSRDDCFGRYLSQDPADLTKIVFPD